MTTEIDGVNGIIKNTTSDGDITIKGNDGGSEISAVTFDMSDAGAATFNGTVYAPGLSMNDNQTIFLGNSADLRLYHDGSNSYIQDTGTGDLKIISDGNAISLQKSTSETMAFFDTDGPVYLYHDNSQKFVTASDGVDITGDVGATTATIAGNISQTTGDYLYSGGGNFDIKHNTASQNIAFSTTPSGGSATERMRIKSDGKVGIGNTSPKAALHVTGSNGILVESENTNGDGQIYFGDTTGTDRLYLSRSLNDFAIWNVSDGIIKLATNNAERIRITSDGKVGIGATTPAQQLSVLKDQNADTAIRVSNGTAGTAARSSLFLDVDGGGAQLMAVNATFSTSGAYIADNVTFVSDTAMSNGMTIGTRSSDAGAHIRFFTQDSESVRIQGNGYFLVGKTSNGSAEGCELHPEGQGKFIRDQGVPLVVQRNGDDGDVVKIQQAGSLEGTISVSGTTVSYNAFTGGHWSRLADNSKPTILRGTIMESIDEMCDWYQAVAEVAESTDDEGNVTPAHTVKEPIALGDKSVGDAITFTSDEIEYTGTIVKEDDIKHTKSKVSDTADSKKVYGVFSNWDDADDGLDGDVNDMNIAQVGTYIIRVNKDVTVEAGDLLVSNGDGTAKVQDDDIIRSKTVAKVNSNIKVETYSDGSYTVPCTLHC